MGQPRVAGRGRPRAGGADRARLPLANGRWEADESAAVAAIAADDGPGRPGVDEAESSFWHACGSDGQDKGGDGGGAYRLWIGDAP